MKHTGYGANVRPLQENRLPVGKPNFCIVKSRFFSFQNSVPSENSKEERSLPLGRATQMLGLPTDDKNATVILPRGNLS